MITETGEGLSVLIVTESDLNWQTFATWYSMFKNLPDAKRAIVCQRNGETPFVFYQWAKRIKEPILRIQQVKEQTVEYNLLESLRLALTQKVVGEALLLVRPFVMALDVLEDEVLRKMNSTNCWFDDEAWFLREPDINKMIDDYILEDRMPVKMTSLCADAKTGPSSSLVSYRKGCGRWINTSKGCPFSSAARLESIDMSANERKVIELWKKMVPLYNALV